MNTRPVMVAPVTLRGSGVTSSTGAGSVTGGRVVGGGFVVGGIGGVGGCVFGIDENHPLHPSALPSHMTATQKASSVLLGCNIVTEKRKG